MIDSVDRFVAFLKAKYRARVIDPRPGDNLALPDWLYEGAADTHGGSITFVDVDELNAEIDKFAAEFKASER